MKFKFIISILLIISILMGCSVSKSKPDTKTNQTGSIINISKEDKNIEISETKVDTDKNIIYLKNDNYDLTVDASTLEVTNADKQGNEVKISDPVGKFEIDTIQHIDNGVKFTIQNENINVLIKLTNNKFNIDFTTDEEKSFSWPKLQSTIGFDSYIMPHHEGKYIPKDDNNFINFLTQYESWDCLEFLSMPFIGLYNTLNTYTYILKTGYNNDISFNNNKNLGLELTHNYTSNHEKKEFAYEIVIGKSDYIQPAKNFRDYLIETNQFKSLAEKAEDNENVEKLYGAVQIYLWSSGVLDKSDINNWIGFVNDINNNQTKTGTLQYKIWNGLEEESKNLIDGYCKDGYVDNYGKKTLIRNVNTILKDKQLLKDKVNENMNDTEIYKLNLTTFYNTFKKYFAVDIKDVGNAFSTKMLNELQNLGIKKAWLGGDNMAQNWQLNEYFTKAAIDAGYLIGSYDSYHSMHEPGKVQWDTAAFDKSLWDTGGIMRKDGSYVGGYKQVGRKVSPLVALPYVKDRMSNIMDSIDVNSWFVDCDAAGELYEDYNPLHTASKEDDALARKERLQWMIDKYDLVVGSEGGKWYLADTIHFGQGMMTPVIAWGDEDMRKNKDSKYYLGKYWPTEGPETFVKQVPLKDEYEYIYFNPKFRLPLYQTVYHDSIVTTSHWGSSSLKFTNEIITNALTELLYNVPPLYNLNLEELEKHGEFISKVYDAFSNMHQITATLPLETFEFITDDRQVQKTKFGDEIEVIANYKDKDIVYENRTIPTQSVEITYIKEGKRQIFTP